MTAVWGRTTLRGSRAIAWGCAAGCLLGGTLGGAFAGLGGAGRAVAADIGVRNPQGVLPVRPENKALADAAAELVEKFADGTAAWKDKSLDELKAVNPLVLGQIHVQGEQVARLAERLALLGEPCGEELRLRKKVLREGLQTAISSLTTVRGAELQKALPQILARSKQRQAKLPAIAALVKQAKWDEAERELFAVVDELEAGAVYFDGRQRGEIYAPYGDAIKAVTDGIREQARKRFAADLAAARTAAETTDAAAAKLFDQAPAGAPSDRINALSAAAQAAAEAGLRARAWEWANLESPEPDRVAQLEQLQEARLAGLRKALVAAVDHAAASTPPNELRIAYGNCVVALAPIAAESADPALVPELKAALDRLAGKLPALAADVTAYGNVTNEILRWRRRSVEIAAGARKAEFRPLTAVLLEAGGGGGSGQGLFSSAARDTGASMFSNPLPAIVPDLESKLVGKKVVASDLRRALPAEGEATQPPATAAYVPRQQAFVPLDPAIWAANSRQLLHELQIDAAHPPLTLEAAVAQYQVERGLFAEVGGEVQGAQLRGLPTAFTGWKTDTDYLRRGPFPPEKTDEPFRGIVLVSLLQPKWVRTEFVFAFRP